jgi:hypothetical protein
MMGGWMKKQDGVFIFGFTIQQFVHVWKLKSCDEMVMGDKYQLRAIHISLNNSHLRCFLSRDVQVMGYSLDVM